MQEQRIRTWGGAQQRRLYPHCVSPVHKHALCRRLPACPSQMWYPAPPGAAPPAGSTNLLDLGGEAPLGGDTAADADGTDDGTDDGADPAAGSCCLWVADQWQWPERILKGPMGSRAECRAPEFVDDVSRVLRAGPHAAPASHTGCQQVLFGRLRRTSTCKQAG